MQEHKHHSTTSEPGQYSNRVTCITSLCRKPFPSFTLFIFSKFSYFHFFHFSFFKELCVGTYLFQRWKRDPDLLRVEEVVPSKKYVMYTSDILVKVFSLTLLYLTELTRVNPKQPTRVGGTS